MSTHIDLSYYFDAKQGHIFIKDQFVTGKVEFLNHCGIGFEHYHTFGQVEYIRLQISTACNSQYLTAGRVLVGAWITIGIRKKDGTVENTCIHEVSPLQVHQTKSSRNAYIRMFKSSMKQQYDDMMSRLNDKELVHKYIADVQYLCSRKWSSEREFESQIHTVSRWKTDNHPDSDGMVGSSRTDNPLRKLVKI